jgi:hypothetical protein
VEERTGFARPAIEQGYPIFPFAAIGADDMLDVIVELHPRRHRRQHGDAADGDEEHERDAADRRHSLGEGEGEATAPATAGIVRRGIETSTSGATGVAAPPRRGRGAGICP